MIHSLFLALLDLFFWVPNQPPTNPGLELNKLQACGPQIQYCNCVKPWWKRWGRRVVQWSLILWSFNLRHLRKVLGVGRGGCVTFFLGGNTGRWEGFLAKQNKKNGANMQPHGSILAFFLYIFLVVVGESAGFCGTQKSKVSFFEGYFSSKRSPY